MRDKVAHNPVVVVLRVGSILISIRVSLVYLYMPHFILLMEVNLAIVIILAKVVVSL